MRRWTRTSRPRWPDTPWRGAFSSSGSGFSPREEATDSIGHDCRPAHDVRPCEANDGVARHGKPPIAVAVILKGSASVVACVAVDLHHDGRAGPEKVHDVVEQRHVHCRLGKAVSVTEDEEALLQFAPRQRRPDPMTGEHAAQPSSARVPAMASQQLGRIVRFDEPQAISLVECAFQWTRVENAGEIENRSRGGRAGDFLAGRQLVIRQPSWAMHPKARAPSTAGPRSKRHVDPFRSRFGPDRPKGGGVRVAEHRSGAASEDRCHPSAFAGDAFVAHGIDPVVQSMEPPGDHARPDLSLRKAEGIELAGADHPVLALRELGDRARACRGAFSGHTNG